MQYFMKLILAKSLFCFVLVSHLWGADITANPATKIPEVDESSLKLCFRVLFMEQNVMKWR
ncbi:hypothetical protein LS73_006400 [Helicobacter muridarum]|uniref:Uncharacterized protein n=1 Tax=Helicobacter muridarum TaxID=216 RepID=A0A099U0N6_9HELI|nr:hypothetical protein [Helicobacter muridarum]TLD99932.1 hypothetical protein LS73_006400 [Helicobacter muridarum]STQ86852.1 Uncharacterised protein [Helicobacter muridarum]